MKKFLPFFFSLVFSFVFLGSFFCNIVPVSAMTTAQANFCTRYHISDISVWRNAIAQCYQNPDSKLDDFFLNLYCDDSSYPSSQFDTFSIVSFCVPWANGGKTVKAVMLHKLGATVTGLYYLSSSCQFVPGKSCSSDTYDQTIDNVSSSSSFQFAYLNILQRFDPDSLNPNNNINICHLNVIIDPFTTAHNVDNVYSNPFSSIKCTVTPNYDGCFYVDIYPNDTFIANINGGTSYFYGCSSGSSYVKPIFQYMTYTDKFKARDGTFFPKGWYHGVPCSAGVPVSFDIPLTAIPYLSNKGYSINFYADNGKLTWNDLHIAGHDTDGNSLAKVYSGLCVFTSYFKLNFATNYSPTDNPYGNGMTSLDGGSLKPNAQLDENGKEIIQIDDFNISDFPSMLSSMSDSVKSFFMMFNDFLSAVPNVVWAVLIMSISLAVVLRILGR